MLSVPPATAMSANRPLAPAIFGGAAILLGVTSTFATDDGPVLCLFRRCTGGYCPGCGGSRAAAAVVRGDLGAAWTGHPWVVLIALQLVVVAALRVSPLRRRIGPILRPLLLANAALGTVIWVVRLGAGSIPLPFG